MNYSIACPCGTKLSVGANLLGRAVKCPKCAQVLKVPVPAGVSATAVAAPPKSAPAPAALPSVNTPPPRMELPARAAATPHVAPRPAAVPVPAPRPAAAAPRTPPAPPRPPAAPVLDDVEVVDDVEPAPAPMPPRMGPPPMPNALTRAPQVPAQGETPLEEVGDFDGVDGSSGLGGKMDQIKKRDLAADFPVPEHLRSQVEQELSRGERLIWLGQPARRVVFIRALPYAIFGGILFLVMLILMLVNVFGSGFGGQKAIMVLMFTIFAFLGAGVLLSPFYFWWKAKRTVYALTSRRCIVWECQWHGGVRVVNYNPVQLTNMRRRDMWFFGNGAGDLIFRSVTTITVTTGRNGGVSSSTTYYGFLSVERVRDIEKLVRETLVDRMMDRLNDY